MNKIRLKTVWVSIVLGVLLGTSPNWVHEKKHSNYNAPWIHPINIAK